MNIRRAFLAGVIGAGILTIVVQMLRILGVPVNLSLWLGSMVTGGLGGATWVLGFVMHLVLGGLFGIGYAVVFERTRRTTLGSGAGLGVAHGLSSGILIGALPWLHPLVPEVIAAPGMFLASGGLPAVLAFLGLHVMFGAIVGHLYEREPVTRVVPGHGYRMTGARHRA